MLKSDPSAYEFCCINCKASITAEFDRIIRIGSRWEEEWELAHVEETKNHFRMGVVGKSPDGGWPSMLVVACDACGTNHLIYAGVNEVYNSIYTVTVQSVSEMLD